MAKKWQRRRYQQVALVAVRKVRSMVLFWARQCRKSTTLGDIAFDAMSLEPGRNVIAASASLLTGSELVAKTLSTTEQAQIVAREAAAMRAAMANSAAERGGLNLKCANSESGKIYEELSEGDFVDLYSSKRLELRLYFDRTAYSRLLVIAPNPATARGWTGYVVRDEAGFTHAAMERDLQVAVKPIMDTDPTFKMIYASNLPRDDRHPFFEMTLPAPGQEFSACADGHFYRGQNGILVHRVALADAYAAGHVLYDQREGKPMSYEQFCADPGNRMGLDESYRLVHNFGGTAAIDLLAMDSSQRRGVGRCASIFVDNDADFQRAMVWLSEHLRGGLVGIGFDVATTTKQTSNPSSVTVTEQNGIEYTQVINVRWKERQPELVWERLGRIFSVIASRPQGGAARRMCQDATNEKYFAELTANQFRGVLPVEMVVSSESVQPPGYREATNMKTWLGDLYSGQVNDNRYAMPPEHDYKDDHRMVIKDRGQYACEPDPSTGCHGDSFDSGKLAQHALRKGGGGRAVALAVGSYAGGTA